MKPFTFFRCILAHTVNKEPIFAEQEFFTMNKEEILSVSGKVLPKYIIVKRYVPKKFEYKFKPDYEKLLYFKTRESAEFYKERLKHWDEHIENRL